MSEQIIRPMEGVDVEHVLQLAKAMHQEGAYAFIEFDNRTMINTIVGCMENPDSFAYVGTINGEVASAFLGYITTYFFSAERMSEEIGMFTLKEHRKTRLGFKLLKEFISWSKEKGVTEVSIGLSHGFETTYARRLGKFLEKRLGFTEGGIWYKLRG